MEIHIKDQQSVGEVKQAFSSAFPYLKLEFFCKRHLPGHASNFKFLMKDTTILSESSISEEAREITITPEMSVTQLEQGFGERYGLGAQVFRLSGNEWLQTLYTDFWTLERQNADAASDPMNHKSFGS